MRSRRLSHSRFPVPGSVVTQFLCLALSATALAEPPAAPQPTPQIRWQPEPALADAAREAADTDDAEARVHGDPGVGCHRVWARVPAPKSAKPEGVRRGVSRSLAAAGANVDEAGDGALRFVLGRYQGTARLSIDGEARQAEVTACLCSDRYPELDEGACAP